MRVFVVVAIALLMTTTWSALAAPLPPRVLLKQSTTAQWDAFRFSTSSTEIIVEYGILGKGERLALMLQLYDGDGNRLRGRTEFLSGRNAADADAGASSAHVSTDAVALPLIRRTDMEAGVKFLCDAACNPSREFVLVVAGAGDALTRYTAWLTVESPVWLGNSTGTAVGVTSSRAFEATTSASAQAANQGVSVVQVGKHSIVAQDTLVATYLKSGARALQRMSVEPPAGAAISCPCNVTGAQPGAYVFRLDDVDTGGDEAWLAWADVDFP